MASSYRKPTRSRHRTSAAVICVAAAFAITVPAASASATTDESGPLQREVNRAYQTAGFVSVSAELRHGRHVATGRAGVANLRTEQPVPDDIYFRTGSITKTFVATVILQLVAENKLSLDDTVEQWLPGLISGNGNDGAAITLRNLLQHTSGLYDYTNVKDFGRTKAGFHRERFRHYDPEELVALAMQHPPSFPPADNDDPNPNWEYSNTNYIVAGMIIEEVTGQDWRTAVRERILRPLELHHTYLPGDFPFLPYPHAHSYKRFPESRDTWTDTTVRNMSSLGAAGELISTHRDLNRFMTALLGGELLPPPQLAAMKDTVPVTGAMQQIVPDGEYGLSLLRRPLPCGGYQWNLGGSTVGTYTRVGYSDNGTSIVIAATGTGGPEQILRAEKALNNLTDRALCNQSN